MKEVLNMTEGTIEMSEKEWRRLPEIERVLRGEIPLTVAAVHMGVGYRQAKRILAKVRKHGPRGLVHASRGRASPRAIDPVVHRRAIELVKTRYKGFEPTFAAEKLLEHDAIKVDHETLRRWMIEEGLWTPRAGPKHRRRRARRERPGELVQFDGSHHAWFGDRAPPCCLMVMIDDATSRLMIPFAERAWPIPK